MRTILFALLTLAGALRLSADWKITTREGGITRTEYYKNDLYRRDLERQSSYVIADLAGRIQYTIVDSLAREYSTHSAAAYSGFTRAADAGTIVIEVEAKDIGEQRFMLGQPAHHFIIMERRHMELRGQPASGFREITTDGWYTGIAGLRFSHSRVGVVYALGAVDRHGHTSSPEVRITRKGPAIPGLPVWEKTGDEVTEVIELSQAPLDARLFAVPAGFRHISGQNPSWSGELLLRWQSFENWLGSLFS